MDGVHDCHGDRIVVTKLHIASLPAAFAEPGLRPVRPRCAPAYGGGGRGSGFVGEVTRWPGRFRDHHRRLAVNVRWVTPEGVETASMLYASSSDSRPSQSRTPRPSTIGTCTTCM